MEEDSDDNLSFVSLSSDSDYFEADSSEKGHSDTKSFVGLLQQSPSSSSIASRCSFRRLRTKRPAPLPPVKIPEKPDTECDKEDPKIMTTTFVQKFNEALEKFPSDYLVQQQCKNVEEYASHPINLVSSEDNSSLSNAQMASDIKGRNPIKSFTNLQIKMIDDQTEPVASMALENSSTTASYPTQSSVLHPYSAPIYSSLIPSPQSLNQGPFYVASIHDHGSANTVYSSFPGSPSTLIQNPIGDVTGGHYVTVAPLAYVPQVSHRPYSPLSAPITHASRVNVGPLLSNQKPSYFNPLAHSASDPGVHGSMLTTSDFLMTQQAGPSLSRLSEISEDDHSYEDVDHRNYKPDYGDKDSPRRPQRLERSDSTAVAHLYEDLLVSSRWNFKVTFTNMSMVVIATALCLPNFATHLYNLFRLVFGTLFPAYYSYKAVRTKNVKEYVKWMMYWIVFAFFTCAETITDVFFSFWFPFYYEIKILVVLWLLSPATRGSSILYRKFVHPWLTKKEEEIDECIAKAKQQGYTTVVQLGTKGVNYATTVIMQTAIKGGGGLVNQLKRSYSTSEIGEDTADHNRNVKALSHKDGHQSPSEEDSMSVSSGSLEYETRHRAESESISTRTRGHSTGRSVRSSKTKSADVSDVYFHDAPEPVVQRRSPRTHDAGRYPMQLSQEPLLREQVLRRDKRRAITRPKSLTIGGSAASKEAWLEARRNHTTGSIYTNIPESPLEPSNDCEYFTRPTPAFSSMRRKASQSFRSSLH